MDDVKLCWYLARLNNSYGISVWNSIVEEAANDDILTDDEYNEIYNYALDLCKK